MACLSFVTTWRTRLPLDDPLSDDDFLATEFHINTLRTLTLDILDYIIDNNIE